MNARGRTANFGNVLIVHFPDVIGEGTGRVDNRLSPHIPLLSGKLVPQVSPDEDSFAILQSGRKILFIKHSDLRSTNAYPVNALQEVDHFNVIHDCCTVSRGCQGDCQVHPSVVLLTCAK